jgi:pyruvate formate-lyase/glycerol dehydratase family glycyl radical enzyme
MAMALDRGYGIEPFNKDWGTGKSGMGDEATSPFPRINAWREQFLNTPLTLDHERAVLWTESMESSKGKPYIVRCAEALAHVLRNVGIHIGKHELILGNMAAPPRCAPAFPEFSYDWFVDELENAPFNERDGDRFLYTKETEEALKGIHGFWKGNTVHDLAKNLMTEDELKGSGAYGKGVYLIGNYFFGGVGHCSPYYEKVLKLGWKAIRQHVEEKLESQGKFNAEDIKKEHFWKAQLIALDGVKDFILRYAKKAWDMAQSEKVAQRKHELIKMSENCAWIAENPPRTFWEAIQMWWFVTTIVTIEGNGHSIAYGRFDQYMYPYYKKDLADGTATKEFIQELIECGWIKVSELTKIRDAGSTKAFGGVELGGASLTVGGLRPDGQCGVNELSYMCIDATAHVRLHSPWMTTRHHANEPQEWWVKCIKCAKMGFGLPSFFNDDAIIPSMLNRGRAIEDARDYCALGCVEPDATGREYGWHDAAFFNMNKVLELAINNGRCINCSKNCARYDRCVGAGTQLGVATGSLADFKSFDDVKEAYEKQMKYWVDRLVRAENSMDIAHQTMKPLPYLSLLIDDCIDKGTDVTAGGAKYNFIGPQGVGVSNVADGLSAIKQLVFEEKKVSGAEFLDALQNDWEGYEELYALVNSSKVHHYGNNDDYADELARYGALVYCENLEKRPTAHGGIFQPGLYPVSGNVAAGSMQGASPEGRKAGEAVADGVSPVHTSRGSHDISGPTADILSVSKLDHSIASNGTLLNQKFSPSTLAGEQGDENFITMMKVFFKRGGFHNQINVISREILEDAMKNPKKYKGLIIRVAGYSAFFTELDPGLQRDLIDRTAFEF